MEFMFNGCCIGHYDSKNKDCKQCKIRKDCMHITRCHYEDAGLIMKKNYKDVLKTIKKFCHDKHK